MESAISVGGRGHGRKWHMGSLQSLHSLYCLLTQAAYWSPGTAMANVDNDPLLIKLDADIITL